MDGSMYHLIGAVQYDCSSSTKKILMHIIINDVLLYVGVHPKELWNGKRDRVVIQWISYQEA